MHACISRKGDVGKGNNAESALLSREIKMSRSLHICFNEADVTEV